MVHGEELALSTKGFSDIHDLTRRVRDIVERSGIREGIAAVFVTGSTASISTMEYEPALVEDVRDQIEKLAPRTMRTRHSETWGDDNGFSHIRATLMGPGITVPVSNGDLMLGTWQQIVLIDHDNRPRTRKVFVQVVEKG
jgi:secondary thiamine-phosphate synthase enzyme